jgi:NAD(P)-dependent dehydrogenase (short-subunit alcohol dehydrogenase family)
MFDFLADQVCLVTGGTQGIGWAVVQALPDHGAQVYACGLSQESLKRAESERRALPWVDAIRLARCDVTDRTAVESWIGGIYQETGRIDILVNNAAFVRWADVVAMPVEEAEQTMRVGYDGMVYMVKAVLPLMLSAGRGHIVNVGSIAGRVFVGGASAAYAATKAAIDAYSRILQIELDSSPVNVTLLRLGTVAGTDFFKKHVSPSRMPPLTRFMPALKPPQVATAVVQAIHKKHTIITLPRYLAFLSLIYTIAPRFSRWLAGIGSNDHPDYGQVEWKYRSKG